MPTLRIAIAASSALVRAGIADGLAAEGGFEIVGSAATLAELAAAAWCGAEIVVVDALVGQGRVARPWLGIGAQSVPVQGAAPGATEQSGLLVTALVAGGPAERAGLKIGDIIVRAAESAAANLRELRQALAAHVGGIVTLGILRGGAPLDLSAEVGEWPEHRCR